MARKEGRGGKQGKGTRGRKLQGEEERGMVCMPQEGPIPFHTSN